MNVQSYTLYKTIVSSVNIYIFSATIAEHIYSREPPEHL